MDFGLSNGSPKARSQIKEAVTPENENYFSNPIFKNVKSLQTYQEHGLLRREQCSSSFPSCRNIEAKRQSGHPHWARGS